MTSFDDETARMIAANKANWDARAPIHLASAFYGLDGSRPAESWFADYEWTDLGPIAGKNLLHLQCHLGTETVAFASKGAKTTGLDLSGESIQRARRLAQDRGLDITYVEADVHDADTVLDRTFDIVYTGKGSVCYLPDLDRWAGVVANLLNPGGSLYLVEFHPLLYALGVVPIADDESLLLRADYLGGRGPEVRDSTRTYTDGPPLTEATASYEWRHGIGEVVTALTRAGLRIDVLREDPRLPWPRWTTMEAGPDGWFRLEADEPRIPLFYAVKAVR
ncbi:MAG: class I SAM-dependent methyltransferase [Actinophytocola sp.]|uniref:class I SAM-dependent methyltransferase n=1 Tax=Actinophytocola sp. TaxID=1872138 RepID=UPI003D6B3DB5